MNNSKITPPVRVRQSNIELLRMLSMFMVLVLHSTFITFGQPDASMVQTEPYDWIIRFMLAGSSVVAVNAFVFISGWFGIHPKVKSICSFLFQIVFLKLLSFAVCVSIGLLTIDKESLKELLMVDPWAGWFIKSYLLLYILSPVLNSFVKSASRELFRRVLIWYFAFYVLMDLVVDVTGFIRGGYSITAFVGLYLLARYVRTYSPKWAMKSRQFDVVVYCSMTMLFFMLTFIPSYFSMPGSGVLLSMVQKYNSPLVIVGTMALVLYFSKLRIGYSRSINWVAQSCFAVYLLHTVWGHLFEWIRQMHASMSFVLFYVSLSILLVTVYVLAVLVDKVRIWVWKQLSPYLLEKWQ